MILTTLVVLGLIPILFPLAWMVSTSLKSKETAGDYPPSWIPRETRTTLTLSGEPVSRLANLPNGAVRIRRSDGEVAEVNPGDLTVKHMIRPRWENYVEILTPAPGAADRDFFRFLLNTLLICSLSVMGQIVTSAMVGWGFARLEFTGKRLLFGIMLATLMLPAQITLIPVFMLYKQLGWIDTFLPLIVPAWCGSAFFAFLYRQAFMAIPREMDEAAAVDGCSPFRTFFTILLPMARPVSVTVGVYTFFGAWNEFLGPLIFVNSDHKRTLSLALAKFQGAYSTDIPMVMTGATLMLIPVLVIYLIAQRSLIQGTVVSGVKG